MRFSCMLRLPAGPPPELAPEDAAWLDAHLHDQGLRE
jgi:hypothetical protein